ncbi:helix-turn-helix domain-containing protein [Planobispora rosea]|uniref:helix-turn-helix domain-containing protein n=1 Tax=Planobispora rosea TaxID=35762 RepID=UPI00083B66B1|nr:helix-turn-helix domain-containing protein [Planobispora rosea]
MPTVPEPLLTVRELAAVFRVDPRTIQRWAKAGRIKAVVTPGGRLRRFRRADVAALVADETPAHNESGPASAATPDGP